jgi:hypothetical protein
MMAALKKQKFQMILPTVPNRDCMGERRQTHLLHLNNSSTDWKIL